MKKILVTKNLIRQIVLLADKRYVSRRKTNPNATLTECRDKYWKLYSHWYQRVGKAFAVYGAELDAQAGIDYGMWLSVLTESELAGYLNKLRDHYLKKNSGPKPDIAPVVSGAGELEDDNLDDGGGIVVDAQSVNDLQVPSGFVDPENPPGEFGSFDSPHIIDTSHQNQLVVRVREALLSVTRNRVTYNREDGAISSTRLTDIAQGINLSGLYHHRTEGRALKVACQIYIDLSGSMIGAVKDKTNGDLYKEYGRLVSRFTLVERLCYALGNALEQLRIPYQIIGFNDFSVLLKDFNGRIGNSPLNRFKIEPRASTHLGSSLQLGLPMLAPRREPRKVAFILTDGDVGNVEHILPKYPQIETCAFGIEAEPIPQNVPFTYRLENLSGDLIEKVASKVADVIVRPESHKI